jgi:hypothetical protein
LFLILLKSVNRLDAPIYFIHGDNIKAGIFGELPVKIRGHTAPMGGFFLP